MQIVESVSVKPNTNGVTAGLFASPAYWSGFVYEAGVDDPLNAFALRSGVLTATPVSQSSRVFGCPGATLSLLAGFASRVFFYSGPATFSPRRKSSAESTSETSA